MLCGARAGRRIRWPRSCNDSLVVTWRVTLPTLSFSRSCTWINRGILGDVSPHGETHVLHHTLRLNFIITRRHDKRRHMRDVWITLYNPTSLLGFYDDEWGRADRGGVVGTWSAEVPLLHRKCLLFIMMYIFALAWKWDNYDLWADRFPPPRLYSCIPAQPFHLSSWDCFMKNKINLKNPHMI